MIKVHDIDFSRFAPEFTASSQWGKCLTSFLAQLGRTSGSLHSLLHYTVELQRFFSLSPQREPHMYTREDIESYINRPGQGNGREGRPVKTSSLNCRLSILSSFYKYSAAYGVAGPDGHQVPIMPYLSPTSGVRYGMRSQAASDKSLSDQEIQMFFHAIGTSTLRARRDRLLFLFMFLTARRVSEVISLRWMDIEKSVVMDGRTPRASYIYRWKGKGHAEIDDLAPMPPIVAAALMDFRDERGRQSAIEDTDYIFCALPDYRGRLGYDPKRHLIAQEVWTMVRKYGARAGIQRSIGTHTFRHSSARSAYALGASARDIMAKLRHKSLKTTTGYLETLLGQSDPTIDLLESRFPNL